MNLYPKIFLQLVTVTFAVAIKLKLPSHRVINGLNALPNEFPFLVSIRHNRFQHHCGGSIITDRHILTAAHCVVVGNDPANYTIFIGSHKLTEGIPKAVESIKIHKQYQGAWDWWKNDLAIFKLTEPLKFTKSIQPIKIAQVQPNDFESLTAAGWGYTMQPSLSLPNVQQKLAAKQFPHSKCKELWSNVIENQLCFWNGPKSFKGICQNDSGGPVINNKTELVGVISWTATTCAYEKPDVAVKLAPGYLGWINQNL